MIKNILFDLDETILDFHLAERLALIETLEYLGIEAKEETLKRYSELNLAHWRLLEEGKLSREEVKVGRYEALFKEIGADCCAKAATSYYERQLGTGHYFIDGAEEVLNILSDKYRLYIVTNGTESVQKSRIASAGIGRFFDNIFISQEIGFDKPSVEFFKHCFSKIDKFRKSETIIVGDSLTSDIQGGKNAAIKTIWFNHRNAVNLLDIVPDYEIKKLLDLPELLNNL